MNRKYPKILRNRKQRIERRLKPKNWEDQPRPMLKASNIHYEMAERTAAMNCGGIGAMHLMVQRLGLVEDINRNLHLLKPIFYSKCRKSGCLTREAIARK